MTTFLEFPQDEVLVALDDIVMVRALVPDDFERTVGHPPMRRPIPEQAVARIDTRSAGHFYVTEDYTTIKARMHEAARRGEA